MSDFKPTDDQMNDEIGPSYGLIIDELEELQESLGCPDSFIYGLLESIAGRWEDRQQQSPTADGGSDG